MRQRQFLDVVSPEEAKRRFHEAVGEPRTLDVPELGTAMMP